MNRTEVNTSADPQADSRRLARIGGLCYLIVIVGGLFAEGFVRGSLIIVNDADATAQSITANESLWRMGLAVHLSYLALALTMNVIIYVLFRPVQAMLARLALIFSLTGLTIEATTLQHLMVPLAMIEDGDALTALGEGQLRALTYLHIRLFANGWGIALFFFAGFCVLTGILIRRSRLIPNMIGAMMIVAGVCYLINSMAIILSPGLSSLLVPWILVPCAVGELSLALWLTVKGVRTETPQADS